MRQAVLIFGIGDALQWMQGCGDMVMVRVGFGIG